MMLLKFTLQLRMWLQSTWRPHLHSFGWILLKLSHKMFNLITYNSYAHYNDSQQLHIMSNTSALHHVDGHTKSFLLKETPNHFCKGNAKSFL